jgi:hypothetical protein
MKKVFLICMLALFSIISYSQVAPGGVMRISDRTTVFGHSLPAGVMIFAVADSTVWITKKACISSLTVNTALAADKVMLIVSGAEKTAGAMFSQSFEAGAPDAEDKSFTLSHNPIDTTSITVSLNSQVLKRTTDFWCRTVNDSTITIHIPCYQYDKVTVWYMTTYGEAVTLWGYAPVVE